MHDETIKIIVNKKFLDVSDVRHYAEGVAASLGRPLVQRRKNLGSSEEEKHWYCHLRFCVSLQNSVVYCVLLLLQTYRD